ncbi:MAG: glycine--tRNA ligase [Candidatus Bathyarchaeota archaeon]|nr:glycine--tRNA ligase [Candidatus Bathyarchaeota archaeon]
MKSLDKYEKVSELGRRRGFFWPSFEIYGGVSGFMNWGPLGSVMKRKIEDKWREMFLQQLGLYELESPVITPERVFKASGHIKSFKEPMVECVQCKRKFRADHLLQEFAGLSSEETDKMGLKEVEETIKKHDIKCLECGGTFSPPRYFLTMFKTAIGPYSEAVGYGRPEAAQGIFVEFRRLYEQARERLPMGFATIGHALRNEISPRQGPIRLREFTIIDLEFFIDPEVPECPPLDEVADEVLRLVLIKNRLKGSETPVDVTAREALAQGYIQMEWQAFFMALAKRFLVNLGIPEDKQRFIEKFKWERAHYSVQGFDQEVFLDRWGWVEVSGFNYRTDYDLKGHTEESGVDMQVFKEGGEKTVRTEVLVKPVTALIGPVFKGETAKVIDLLNKADARELQNAFEQQGFYKVGKLKILPEYVKIITEEVEETGRRFIPHVIEPSFGSDRLAYVALEYAYATKEGRVVLKLPREIAPVQLAVLPLVSKDGLPERARQLHRMLVCEGFAAEYDESGSIGRRYARFDEIGTPLCITVDYRTLEDNSVTIRDKASWKQVRTGTESLPRLLHDYFRYRIGFGDLGSPA